MNLNHSNDPGTARASGIVVLLAMAFVAAVRGIFPGGV